MPKSIPKIQKYMTVTPYAIHAEASLHEASEAMKKHHIRHLPVMKGANAFGLISESDIKSILSFAGANPNTMKVGDVCTDEPYLTKPDAGLNEVAIQLVERRIGSALVIDNGKLVGIFTVTDACRALAEVCEMRFHN